MVETMEVLVRQYELNSIDNNNSYTTRNRNRERNAKSSVKREEVEEAKQPEQTEQQTEQETGTSTQLFVPSENVMRSVSSMVLSKGEHIGRGHTAYLTFATKLK